MGHHRDKSLIGKLLESCLLCLKDLALLLFFLRGFLFDFLLLFNEDLFALFIEIIDRLEVIVWSSESLNVNSHALEHFVLVAVSIQFEHLCFVLLEKLLSWEHIIVDVRSFLEKFDCIVIVIVI